MMGIPVAAASGKSKVINQGKRKAKIREFLMAFCSNDLYLYK
jgi:hypothetical protein